MAKAILCECWPCLETYSTHLLFGAVHAQQKGAVSLAAIGAPVGLSQDELQTITQAILRTAGASTSDGANIDEDVCTVCSIYHSICIDRIRLCHASRRQSKIPAGCFLQNLTISLLEEQVLRLLCRPSKSVTDTLVSHWALGYWSTVHKRVQLGACDHGEFWLLKGLSDDVQALTERAVKAGADPTVRNLISANLLHQLPLVVKCVPMQSGLR